MSPPPILDDLSSAQLKELAAQLLAEVSDLKQIIAAQREEIARLKSHLAQLRELLTAEGEIGKKLDFLLQEVNREANTTLSKSAELAICDAAIEIKTEVEKLREQAQNVE